MKVLLLTTEYYTTRYSEFYSGMHKQLGSMDVRRLGMNEQPNLREYFTEHVDLTKFDRIIIHLDFKILKSQLRFLKHVEDVVFYNTEALFGCEKNNARANEQLRFFKKLPWAKIIVTNFRAMKLFQDSGLDAWCVPEGYNSTRIASSESGNERSIDLGFIRNRTALMSAGEKELKKQLLAEYPNMHVEKDFMKPGTSQLEQVRIAVCADVEQGEYSGKVFQAMASGCLVLSYHQGDDETFCLSLKDMENIVLFQDFTMLREQINYLLSHPEQLERIATQGHELATSNHQEAELGRQAGNYIAAGVRERDDYGLGIVAFGFRV